MSIRSLTQEDPIGLAGGLNLYGFANGDPVNFSDPFGLCPFCHLVGPLSVKAAEELGSEGADVAVAFTPVLSTIDDAKTALTGRTLAGTETGLGGRLAAVAGFVTPVSGGQIRGAITGAKHVVTSGLRRVTAAYSDAALRRTYRNAINEINRHKEILKSASPEQINPINVDIRKHEQRLQAIVEEMQRRQ